jgi:hypothetical protein
MRKRFDALKAAVGPSHSSAFEAALDALGVVERKRSP